MMSMYTSITDNTVVALQSSQFHCLFLFVLSHPHTSLPVFGSGFLPWPTYLVVITHLLLIALDCSHH